MESEFQRYCVELGRRVKRLRERRGLTQEGMAELGFSLRHYQRIEAGRSITIRTVWKLAKALGVPPSALLPPLSTARSKR